MTTQKTGNREPGTGNGEREIRRGSRDERGVRGCIRSTVLEDGPSGSQTTLDSASKAAGESAKATPAGPAVQAMTLRQRVVGLQTLRARAAGEVREVLEQLATVRAVFADCDEFPAHAECLVAEQRSETAIELLDEQLADELASLAESAEGELTADPDSRLVDFRPETWQALYTFAAFDPRTQRAGGAERFLGLLLRYLLTRDDALGLCRAVTNHFVASLGVDTATARRDAAILGSTPAPEAAVQSGASHYGDGAADADQGEPVIDEDDDDDPDDGIIDAAGRELIQSHRTIAECVAGDRDVVILKVSTTACERGGAGPVDIERDVVSFVAVSHEPQALERACRKVAALAREFDPWAQNTEDRAGFREHAPKEPADESEEHEGGAAT